MISVIGNNFGEFKGLCKKNLHESHLPGELGHCISLDREFSQNFNSIYEQTGEWLLRFGSISDFNKNLMSNSDPAKRNTMLQKISSFSGFVSLSFSLEGE